VPAARARRVRRAGGPTAPREGVVPLEETIPTRPTFTGAGWLGWVAANVAGLLLPTALIVASTYSSADGVLAGWVNLAAAPLLFAIQWIALRRVLPRLRWTTWVGAASLASLLSTLFTGVLYNAIADRLGPDSYGFSVFVVTMVGASIGLAQSFILGRYVQHAALWIASTRGRAPPRRC